MAGITPATDVGTLAQVLGDTGLVKQTIDALTRQSSTGFIAPDYAGLGAGARVSINLTVQLSLNKTSASNADAAANIQQISQLALGQIQTIVTAFSPQLLSAQTSGLSSISTLGANARDALAQIAGLLDTKVGDVYVFAGQDSHTPPVPDPATITQSTFYAAIQAVVATLGTVGAANVQSQTLVVAGAGPTSPFAASLEASNAVTTVDLGDGSRLQVGVLADRNTDAVSSGAGTTSTGSYMRDILQGLATVGSLTAAQANDPQLPALLQNTSRSLQAATSALNTDIGGLGTRQARVTTAKTDLADVSVALTAQLSSVQEVDLAQVSTRLADAQTQLQASYHVLAALAQLSLAKFLPA